MQSLNQALYRELRSDYPQDIFPKVACKRTTLGDGDTFFSVQQIVSTINTYYTQCNKIAKLLRSKCLEGTCENVHYFLYSHFQYKADSSVQQLRSPACSWVQRIEGIDCKSYTILAGAILKAMGFNSYVRQIKQPYSSYPDEYSHVYLVVPKDQKSFDLTKGYYVIDGTIPTMTETIYSEKADEIVTTMKHIGLNGAQNALFGYSYKGLRAIPSGGTPDKGDRIIEKIDKRFEQAGGIIKKGAGIYGEVDNLIRGNHRTNPTNPPAKDYSSEYERNQAEAAYKRQQAEALARQNEEARRRQQAENNNYEYSSQGNSSRGNGNNPQGFKDNTLWYVLGGVAVLGTALVVVMNKKK